MAVARYLDALRVSETQAVVTMTTQDELELVIPGRAFKAGAKNDPLTARHVEQMRELHKLIQRTMTGRKLSNARKDLPAYIGERYLRVDEDGPLGDLGAGVLYTPDKLDWSEDGRSVFLKPGVRLMYLDYESRGEGKLTYIEQANGDERVEELLARSSAFVVHHGISPTRAASHFRDYNGRGVPVTPNLLVARDELDPFTIVARDAFEELGLELELESRQVPARSEAIMTALSARMLVAAMFHGVGAISYGSKPIPTERDEVGKLDVDRLQKAAHQWVGRLIEVFGAPAFKDRELVLRAVPVLVSLGALGQAHYLTGVDTGAGGETVTDERIDWSHASGRWDGIAGKRSPAGTFSVGSGKEYAHATFAALTKPDSPGYAKIRGTDQQAAA